MADRNLTEQVGKRIRRLRQQAGLSQAQLADSVEMSRAHLGAVERGEKSPTVATLERLGRGVAVPAQEFLRVDRERASKTRAERLGHLVATLAKGASKKDMERFERLIRAYFSG